MQTIIVRAMHKQQNKRFRQASEMLRALKNIDQMDRNYKNYQVRKRVITLALAACFAASAYSCYYGTERMRSERENVYLLNLAQAEQAEQNADYNAAQQLLEELVDSGYDTIATRLNLATVLQALDQYSEAEKVLKDLQEQYPSDYRFDMQMAQIRRKYLCLPDRSFLWLESLA